MNFNLVVFGFEVRATPARIIAFLISAIVLLLTSFVGWMLTFGWIIALVVWGLLTSITVNGTRYALIQNEVVHDWVGGCVFWVGLGLAIYHFFF